MFFLIFGYIGYTHRLDTGAAVYCSVGAPMSTYAKILLASTATILVVGCRTPLGPDVIKNGSTKLEVIKNDPSLLPKKWIKGKTTLDQAKSQFQRLTASQLREWEAFIKQLKSSDELYSWLFVDINAHKHHSGYCIIRNNKTVSIVHLESWTSYIE